MESLYKKLHPSEIKKINEKKNKVLDELVVSSRENKGLESEKIEAYSQNSRVVVLGALYACHGPVRARSLRNRLKFNLQGELIALLDRKLVNVVDRRCGTDLYMISDSGRTVYTYLIKQKGESG